MHQKTRHVFICSILVALIQVSVFRPLTVFAAEDGSVVLSGHTRLSDDFEGETLQVPEGKATLNLNGQTLTVSGITVEQGASLEITGSGQLTVSGPFRVFGSSITFSMDEDSGVTAKRSLFADSGTLQMESGTLLVEGSYLSAETLTVSGGEIIANTRYDAIRTSKLLRMTDGALSAHGGIHGIHAHGDVEITGGTLEISGRSDDTYFEDEARVHLAHGVLVTDAEAQQTTRQTAAAATSQRQQTPATANTGATQQATRQTAAAATTGTGASAQAATGASNTGATQQATRQTQAATAATSASTQAQTPATASTGATQQTTRQTAAAATSQRQQTPATAATSATSQRTQTVVAATSASVQQTQTPAGTGASTRRGILAGAGLTIQHAQAAAAASASSATSAETAPAAEASSAATAGTDLQPVTPPQMAADTALAPGLVLLTLSSVTLLLLLNDTRKKHR
ncbi:MAG: hypothetical protein IJR00_07025 [Lachnospiraceae bacterium]|nr:hypothetical protein [Lachnospiraceae bacterium]